MYCSVIMGGIFSFISTSDLNNLWKFITTNSCLFISGVFFYFRSEIFHVL